MSNVEFKLPKFKTQVNPLLNEQIRCHGMLIGIYDPGKEDHEQQDAYQMFKQLVFETIPPVDHLKDDGEFRLYAAQPAYAILNVFPKSMRRQVLNSAHNLQSYAKGTSNFQSSEDFLLSEARSI
jgi:hypothetical protein